MYIFLNPNSALKHSAVMFPVIPRVSQDWCSSDGRTVCPDRPAPQGGTECLPKPPEHTPPPTPCDQMAEKWRVSLIFAWIPLLLHPCEHPFMYSVKKRKVASVVSDSLRPPGLQPASPLCLWNSPAIPFSRSSPTQGLNLGLLSCKQMLHRLSHQGNATNFE